jgi:hypothetical protein
MMVDESGEVSEVMAPSLAIVQILNETMRLPGVEVVT